MHERRTENNKYNKYSEESSLPPRTAKRAGRAPEGRGPVPDCTLREVPAGGTSRFESDEGAVGELAIGEGECPRRPAAEIVELRAVIPRPATTPPLRHGRGSLAAAQPPPEAGGGLVAARSHWRVMRGSVVDGLRVPALDSAQPGSI